MGICNKYTWQIIDYGTVVLQLSISKGQKTPITAIHTKRNLKPRPAVGHSDSKHNVCRSLRGGTPSHPCISLNGHSIR